MLRQYLPLLILAFIVGSLFRLYEDSGIGFFRMFGTLGIVVLGFVGVGIINRSQLAEGHRRLNAVIAGLPADVHVRRLVGSARDRVVEGPAGSVVLVTCPAPQYAGRRGVYRALLRAAERARALADQQGANGEQTTGKPRSAVVLLRREVGSIHQAVLNSLDVDVVDLEEVGAYLLGVTGAGANLPVRPQGATVHPEGVPEG